MRRVSIVLCAVLSATAAALPASSAPLFTAPFYTFPTLSRPDELLVLDVNVDGRPDIVTASREGGLVQISLGRVGGGFDAIPAFGAELGYWQSMATGFVDSDSIPDLALTDQDYQAVQLFRGNGDGTFTPLPTLSSGFQTYSVVIADLNGDEKGDLAVGTYDKISVFLGFGDGTFAAPVVYQTDTNVYAITAGDLDHDGDAEVVVAGNRTLTRFLNQGGVLVSPTETLLPSSVEYLQIADANGDPHPDVLASRPDGVDPIILPGLGDGSFGTRLDIDLGHGTSGVSVGDFDGDGRPDLVAGLANYTYSGSDRRAVAVLRGLPGGGFGAPAEFGDGVGSFFPGVGDFDGDGSLDIVAADRGSDDAVLLRGNGNATFGSHVALSAGNGPYSPVLVDLDEDSHLDLIDADFGSSTVSVRYGRGDGTFGLRLAFLVPGRPASVAAGDVDGDGIQDLALAIRTPDALCLLRGDGYRGFLSPVTMTAGAQPSRIVILDLDDDGRSDVAMTNGLGSTLAVWLGQAGGNLGPPAFYGTGTTPAGLASGDVDLDGNLDLAVANSGSGTVTVFMGAGDGTLWSKEVVTVGGQPTEVALARLDEDGWLDLVASNLATSSVNLAFGAGGGTFGPVSQEPAGSGASSLAIADFDGNGAQDLVIGNAYQVSLSLLLGSGDGTFAAQGGIGTCRRPWGLAAGDVNEDGHVDLFALSDEENIAMLHLNQSALVSAPSTPFRPAVISLRAAGAQPSRDGRLPVSFQLAGGAPATLEVFDVRGRRWATRDVSLGAGTHRVDAANGRALTNGIWFVRLREGADTSVARLVVVR